MALDNFRTIELIWDKANKSIIKTIKTASSDMTGRYFSVKVLDEGQEVDLTGAKLQLYWEHPNFNTTGTDDFTTVDTKGNFTMTFSEEMLTNIGELNTHLVLTLPDGKITSDGFVIEVIKGADDGVVVPTNGSGLVKQIDAKIDKGNVTLNDLTQEVKLAMTGGSVAVVGENAILEKNIVDNQVTPKKTSFAETVTMSENIYDARNVATGYGINGNTGELYSATDLSTSDFIKVEPNTKYVRVKFTRVAKYDVNKQFISHFDGGYTTSGIFTTEDNVSYLRVATTNETVPIAMLVKGNTIPTTYIPYRAEIEIVNFKYDEEKIKSSVFPENKLSDEIEIEEVNISFLERQSTNLFDNRKVVPGFINANTGGIVDFKNYHVTDFIVAKPSTLYSANSIYRVGQYDADKQFISVFRENLTSFTTDANTAYLRANALPENLDKAMIAEGSIAGYVPYHRYKFGSSIDIEQTKQFEGGTWNVLGDSITAPNYAYWSVLAPQLGITKVNNYGVGGTSITPRVAPWDENAMSIRYVDMEDADLITVLGGTNDNPGAYEMPEIGTMDDRDTSTFYGSCHVLYGGLIEKYPTKTVAVFTPLPKGSMYNPTDNLEQRVEIIKEVCAYYSIPCLDLYHNSQLKPTNETNRAMYIPDALHPNAEGHKLLARQMLPFLKSL